MQGKKSFILYSDLLSIIEKLPLDKAGELFKLILEYVNDLNPETDDLLLQIAFEPVKLQLKRDLKNWEEIRVKRSESGKLGGRPSNEIKAKKANGFFDKQTKAKKAVNVNDTVNVNDKIILNDIVVRKQKFAHTLEPFLKKYGREMLNDFYGYWTEPNKSKTKFRAELQKTWDVSLRLNTWASREAIKNKKENGNTSKSELYKKGIDDLDKITYDYNQ